MSVTSLRNDWFTQRQAALAAADWHDIPAGRYAIPVVEDDLDDGDPNFCRLLGHKVIERKVEKRDKNGRRIGKSGLRTSTLLAPGVTWPELHAYAERNDEKTTLQPEDILEICSDPDMHQVAFGQVTGRCGSCGKLLTDPKSKTAGIGPECRREGKQWAVEEIKGAVCDAVETTKPGDTARTWTWERPIQGRARKREKVTVTLHPDAVPQPSYRSSREVCSTVLDRLNAGRPKCADPVVWSVTRIGARGAMYRSYYCDPDLPAEYRPEAASVSEGDQSTLF